MSNNFQPVREDRDLKPGLRTATWPVRSVAVGCFGLVTMAMAHATGGVQDAIGEAVFLVGALGAGFGFGGAVHQRVRRVMKGNSK